MPISEYCSRDIPTINKSSTVCKAVEIMREFQTDYVVVTEARQGRLLPIGMLTAKDIIMKGIVTEASASKAFVKDLMSSDLVSCRDTMGIHETIELMEQQGVKRVPVVNITGHLIGLIEASDLFHLLSRELASLANFQTRTSREHRGIESIYSRL